MAQPTNFMVPAGRRLSRVDSTTLRESFTGQDNAELEAVMRNLARKDDKIKYNRRMRIMLAAAVGVMVIMVGAMFAVTFSANEATKESHVSRSGAMVGLDGKTVKTKTLETYAKLFDLPKFDISTLSEIKQLTLRMHSGLQSSIAITKVEKEEGTRVAKFYSANGDEVTVDSDSAIVMANMGGQCQTVDVTKGDVQVARRLSAETARLYEANEFFALSDFEGDVRGSRKLSKDSTMVGFATIAIAATEAALDKVNGVLKDRTYTNVAFSGSTFKAGASCDAAQDFKVVLNKQNKTRVVETTRGDKRTVTMWFSDTVGVEMSFESNKLIKCDNLQLDKPMPISIFEFEKRILAHHGDEFVIQVEDDYLAGSVTLGENAHKIIDIPDSRECINANRKAGEAKSIERNKGRRLGTHAPSGQDLWDLTQCSYRIGGPVWYVHCPFEEVASCENDPSVWSGGDWWKIWPWRGARATLHKYGDRYVMSFSGTDGLYDLHDWVSDLSVGEDPAGPGYHGGFWRYQNSLTKMAEAGHEGCKKIFEHTMTSRDYIVGHSLGGAAATVYHRVKYGDNGGANVPQLATFGAAKSTSGGADHGQCQARPGTRYYHNNDPVASDGATVFGQPWLHALGDVHHDIHDGALEVWHTTPCKCTTHWWGCSSTEHTECGWRGCRHWTSCGDWGRHHHHHSRKHGNCRQESHTQDLTAALWHFAATHTTYHDFV
jgi:hypothetical protein